MLWVGDFNGDGRPDLFAEVNDNPGFFPRQEDGGFGAVDAGHAPSGFDVLYGFALGDLNRDRRTDLIVIGNQEFVTGPTPFVIGCDRAAGWELAGGNFPPDTRILRRLAEEDGGTAIGARAAQLGALKPPRTHSLATSRLNL